MVLILDDYSALVKENRSFREEKKAIFNCSRSNQMLLTDQITETAPYMRTYVKITTLYKCMVFSISHLNSSPVQFSSFDFSLMQTHLQIQ